MTNRNIVLFIKIMIFLSLSMSLLINQAQAQVVVVPLGGLEPVARAEVNFSEGFVGSGIDSINRSATGVYEITFTSSIGTNPIVLLTPYSTSTLSEIMGYQFINTTSITVRIYSGTTNALRSSIFSIMVLRNGS